jgi:predicted AAA+ superfamily ATPase
VALALSLDSLVRKKSDKPPLMVIYGRGKMGKTTLASEFPNPVFIQTEDGAGNLDLVSFKDEPLSRFTEVNEALVALASEDHEFQTLVVDSITHLERNMPSQ